MTATLIPPPSVLGPSEETARSPRAMASRDILTMGPGVVPFGVMLGLTIAAGTTGGLAGLTGAAAVYGGSAQLTAVNILGVGGSAIAAVGSATAVNARILLYGADLGPRFRDQPRWFRLLGPQFILDQTYLSAIARPELAGAAFRRYWRWLGGLLLMVWMASVAFGIYGAAYIPALPHLGLVCIAMFLAMLAPKLVTGRTAVAVVVAAGIALVTARAIPELGILAGTIAGVVVAATLDRSQS